MIFPPILDIYIYNNFLGGGCAVGLIIGPNLILDHDVSYKCYAVLSSNQLLIQWAYRQVSISLHKANNFFLLHFTLSQRVRNRMALLLEKLDFFIFGYPPPYSKITTFYSYLFLTLGLSQRRILDPSPSKSV